MSTIEFQNGALPLAANVAVPSSVGSEAAPLPLPKPQSQTPEVSSAPQHPSAEAAVFEQILEQTGVTEEEVRGVRQFLLARNAEAELLPKPKSEAAQKALQNFLEQSGVPTDSDLETAETLIKSLKNFNPQVVLEETRHVQQVNQKAQTESSSPRSFELVKALTAELENLIQTLEADTAQIQQSQTRKTLDATAARTPPQKEGAAVEQKPVQELPADLKKILSLAQQAHTGAAQTADQRRLEAELRSLVSLQLETVAVLEDRFKATLVKEAIQAPIEKLRQVLDEVLTGVEDPQTPLEATVKTLLQKLSVDIEAALSSNDSVVLKALLAQALHDLSDSIGLPQLNQRIQGEPNAAQFDALPAQLRTSLKLLQNQLSDLVQLSPEDFERVVQGDTANSSIRLPSILQTLKEVEVLFKEKATQFPELLNSLRESIAVLEHPQKEGVPVSVNKPVQRTLQDLLSKIEIALNSQQAPLTQDSRAPTTTVPEKKADPKSEFLARPQVQSQLKKLERGIQEALRAIETSPEGTLTPNNLSELTSEQGVGSYGEKLGNGSRSHSSSPRVTDTQLVRVKELIKNLHESLNFSLKPAESQLFDQTLDLLTTIELAEESSSPHAESQLKDALKKSLTTIKSKFIPERLNELPPVLAALDSRTLKSIESAFSAQEALQRMAPLMEALGEPALLLFPCLMQGMLTHAEVSLFGSSNEMRSGARQSDSKANRDQFERIKISVPMPSIGLVTVDIAHRPGEILVNFEFEKEEIQEIAREWLPKLMKNFELRGFRHSEINVALAKPQNTALLYTDLNQIGIA